MISVLLMIGVISLAILGLSGKLDYESDLPNDSSPSKAWY